MPPTMLKMPLQTSPPCVKRLQGRRPQGLLDFFYIAVEKLIFFRSILHLHSEVNKQ
jgi:hypothetical protein